MVKGRHFDRSMLGFKSMANAQITLSGIELVHMMPFGAQGRR
jgi:transposase-like protein